MVDAQLSIRLEDSIQKAFMSYTAQFKKKAKDDKKRYIDLVEKSMKEIIKDENVVLAKSSSQPQSIYEAAASLTEFELKKILLDKMQKLEKDLYESYGKAYSIKKDCEDKEKDEDPPAGSNQGLKRRKAIKDDEPPKGSKSKDSKSSSSKGTNNLGNTDDQPNVEATSKHDWFKKLKRPPTPDPDWNARKFVDFRPSQTWISRIAQAEKHPLTFDELMSTPIDFSVYVMHNLKIDNLSQEHLVGSTFNLLKGTCRSRVELEYQFEEYEMKFEKEENNRYKFMEGDFPGLNLRDIEDMMLLLVQKKISNLERDVIFDLNVALQIFTRRIVILKRVEDLQLGVESYQKSLISPSQRHSGLTFPTRLHTLHTTILKESSIKTSSKEIG
ncbi:hypothetical protein Tco_0647412 [Tanacetum coccineum]